jgi:hypothetical protein
MPIVRASTASGKAPDRRRKALGPRPRVIAAWHSVATLSYGIETHTDGTPIPTELYKALAKAGAFHFLGNSIGSRKAGDVQ